MMYSMLLLFFLYLVFHPVIKAKTVHQNFQIMGDRMQMFFLTIRFMLLWYVMKYR